MTRVIKTPLPLGETEGPATGGRGRVRARAGTLSMFRAWEVRALTLPMQVQWAPPSPLKGEGS